MFYSENQPIPKATITEVDNLDKELNAGQEAALLETKLSSLVWICTSTHAASIVTVIDANDPAEILNSFGVSASYILCIASVPGASLDDYNDTSADVVPEDEADDAHKPAQNSDHSSEMKDDGGDTKEDEMDKENVSVDLYFYFTFVL